MSKFVKVRIYCKGDRACFDNIRRSNGPSIVINIDAISTINENAQRWFCDYDASYLYGELRLVNGEYYLLPIAAAKNLALIVLSDKNE